MSLRIGDNFNYQGKKPNFARDTFATLAEMKAYPETSIDEYHVSVCLENGIRYIFSSLNETDATTGKWRVYIPVPDETLSETSENYVQNKAVAKAVSDLGADISNLGDSIDTLDSKINTTKEGLEGEISSSASSLQEEINTNSDAISSLSGDLDDAKEKHLEDLKILNGALQGLKENLDTLDEVFGETANDLKRSLQEIDLSPIESEIRTIKGDITSLKNGKVNISHLTDYSNPHKVNASQVGLGNVNNTSDLNKPISNATQTALNGKVDKAEGKGLSTNDFTDDLKSKLDGISSGAQVNTITGVKGESETLYRTGQVSIGKANIGLGNVDNTSDLDKPISIATQTALNEKLGISLKGAAGGLAELDSSGHVPSSQLPGYVDNIIEGYYDSEAGKFYEDSTKETEIPGEAGKIYVDLTTNVTYRWSGSRFVEISQSLALGTTTGTAYDGGSGQALAEGKADKATTLIGYGIEDAKIEGNTITLGSNTITPLTEETDPTVPGWAKAATKPSYSTSEITGLENALGGKVDKVEGKGLSANDFTNEHKTKLSGIESGAQVNTITGVKGSAEGNYRTGDISISKANIGLDKVDNTSDLDKPVSNATQTALSGKVDKVNGKGLSTYDFNDTLKLKLDGIESGAQKNTVLGVKGSSETDYRTGQVSLSKSDIGLGNVDNTSDLDKPISNATQTALNEKVDKVSGKGLSTNDFTTALKNKLDGIEEGAQVNSITGVKGSAESAFGTGNVVITKSSIGLGNVDNTSDLDKPVSSATQEALNEKVDKVEGKDLSTNDFTDELKTKLSGIETGAQKNTILGVKGSSESTYRTGQVSLSKSDIGLGNVDNTSDLDKPVSSATNEALRILGSSISSLNEKIEESEQATAATINEIMSFLPSIKFWVGSQAEYNAMSGHDKNTLYIIK